MSKYSQLLADIELDSEQKQYRQLSDMAIEAIEDECQQIALDIAMPYLGDFPDVDIESDEFLDEFLNPIFDKVLNAVFENLGFIPRPI